MYEVGGRDLVEAEFICWLLEAVYGELDQHWYGCHDK